MGHLHVDGEIMSGTGMRYCSEKWIHLPHGPNMSGVCKKES